MITSIHRLPAVSPGETLTGRPGIVDLWCFLYEGIDEPALLASYDAILAPEERARRDRFRFERDRRLFLATRAHVRTVLSHYADVAAKGWQFGTGERGKPHVACPAIVPMVHFNLSNTRGLVACAVSVAHHALGVDVEALDRPAETFGLASRYFSAQEVHALRALPPTEQRARFFSYWTLKESYIKARGLGLAVPLDQVSFLLDDEPDIGVAFDPRLDGDPQRWRFALLAASPRHTIAVAADTGGASLSLRVARWVPLRGIVPF